MFLAGGPFGLGPLELFLIVVVLLLVFGVGKIADLGGSLGTGIREFRRNIKDDSPEPSEPPAAAASAIGTPAVTSAPASASAVAPPHVTSVPAADSAQAGPQTVAAIKCPSCGSLNPVGARHCNQCGTVLTAHVS